MKLFKFFYADRNREVQQIEVVAPNQFAAMQLLERMEGNTISPFEVVRVLWEKPFNG